ncbi:uncharacterized protein BDR25DRAFT_314382 [Lindgomyces ingoldianus]|uniref:Uncharacterized protein n=1 Tax=Lindgomyces ingoldianus TaxID=673940 RepID=A0ACB6QUX4_9PLEO|nr:uncharacterized protein BDR25DRAFT_314382 [Lindgomyces ingoldianus]KAF2470685.1 hypothetical protein BDR25DRAFT_314382 [Lindgomyces ingoldianus]
MSSPYYPSGIHSRPTSYIALECVRSGVPFDEYAKLRGQQNIESFIFLKSYLYEEKAFLNMSSDSLSHLGQGSHEVHRRHALSTADGGDVYEMMQYRESVKRMPARIVTDAGMPVRSSFYWSSSGDEEEGETTEKGRNTWIGYWKKHSEDFQAAENQVRWNTISLSCFD